LAAIVAGLAASFFLFGHALIYWRNADMDFMVIYNALVLNDGKPQLFFDHTAYITILSVKLWYRLLHAFGLLDAWSLSAIPSASDAPAFDAAMTHAVRAGRLLAFLIATGSVLVFAALVRLIVRDRRVAMFAALAFAFSGGIAVHSRILRSELVAACPVIFALMILIVIGRRASITRPLWMAAAAGLCVLGLENKVQAILLIGALPLLAVPFGSAKSASVAFWRNARFSWLAAGIAAIAAISAAWAAWPLIATGFDRALLDAAHFRPLLLGRFGIYQAALPVLVGGCMIAFAVIWRVSATETLASVFAVAAGALIALLALDLEYNASNVIAVFNPLEKMLTFADATTTDAASGAGLARIVLLLLDGVASVLARYTFVLHSSPRPTLFLTWLIVRHRLCVAARRKAGRDLGPCASHGGDRDRRARRAARVEIRIFHLYRPADYSRWRDPARFPQRSALSQMDLPPRRGSVRTAYRRRPGRADKIRLHAQGAGIDLRVEPIFHAAAAAALVQLSAGPAIAPC
jgi:hypothetical protein